MQNITKIPVTIITGFLGSGKTTLISQLMKNPLGKRLAVIVNEFGDIGVDGEILRGCAIPNCPEENIMELANGCICCTVADDFIPTIEALMSVSPQPEHILIETSGLALPKPLLKAFDWPDIRSRITVDGVIALADAEAVASEQFAPDLLGLQAQREADESIEHETPLSEVFEDQIACADLILLTKVDLANSENKAKAKKMIASVPLKLWFSDAYWNENDDRDKHYHEFEVKQFNFLLEKTGWKIINSQKWKPYKKISLGIRPLLRMVTNRYYIVYCEKIRARNPEIGMPNNHACNPNHSQIFIVNTQILFET